MAIFEGVQELFVEQGVYEYLLPFLLVFILTYAILERVKLFGDKSWGYNLVISLVLGILLVRQGDLVAFINTYLPNVSMIVIVFFGFLILLGLFGFGSANMKGGIMILFVLISLAGGIWAFASATEQGDFELHIPFFDKDIEITESDAGIMIVLGVFILIIALAIGYKKKESGFEGFLKGMTKMGDVFAGKPNP